MIFLIGSQSLYDFLNLVLSPFMIFLIGSQSFMIFLIGCPFKILNLVLCPFYDFLNWFSVLYDFLNWFCWRKKIHCRKKIYSTPEIGLHGFLSWLNHTSKTELCILQHLQWNWQIFHFIISLNIFLSIKFKKIENIEWSLKN